MGDPKQPGVSEAEDGAADTVYGALKRPCFASGETWPTLGIGKSDAQGPVLPHPRLPVPVRSGVMAQALRHHPSLRGVKGRNSIQGIRSRALGS